LDFLMNFILGYKDHETYEDVRDIKRITKRYVCR
jgi:hypothetical protein